MNTVQLCVDMQRMFAEDTEWHTPWMSRVRPRVERIAASCPARTIFTRFMPALHAGEGRGTWAGYDRRRSSMTVEALGAEMIDLTPELRRFVPPARVLDKRTTSPWVDGALDRMLVGLGADRLLVTGGETDVCVLATVPGAIDRGGSVTIVTDALCSSCDETHDAMLKLFGQRFSHQLDTRCTE